jgi:hypothetical protein
MSETENLNRSLSRLLAADHDTASTRRMLLLAPLLASLPFALSGKTAQASNIAESARGISPRAAHRSGLDTLASSGSCHRMKAAAFH